MPHTSPSASALVPLADRVRWAALLRVGLFGTAAGLVAGAPARSSGLVGLVAVAHLVLVLVTIAASRVGRRTTIASLNASLVVDGLVLAAVVHVLGDLSGFVTGLYVIHVSGVSLLMSFRTGVKVALWHSLLVLVVLHASAVGILGGGLHGQRVVLTTYIVFLLLLWTAALGTSAFAALNERELRRRRYDAEVLHRFAVALSTPADEHEVVRVLAKTVVQDLGVRRALVALTTGQTPDRPDAVADLHVEPPARLPDPGVPRAAEPGVLVPRPRGGDGSIDVGSLLARATVDAGPVLAAGADRVSDAWLHDHLPDAVGLVVVPLPLGDDRRGWLVLEMGRRRLRGVERRLLATTQQAAAHAALALARAAAVASLKRIAEMDGLTGVANRRAFDAALERTLAAARSGEHGFSVALIDLDHFKAVNDTHGHAVGDEVLRVAAGALRSAARAGDLVARYGGEEFAVILPDDGPGAASAADRLRSAVAEADGPLPVTCSVGVASWTQGVSTGEVLKAADDALYRAKTQGRNRTVRAGELSATALPALAVAART